MYSQTRLFFFSSRSFLHLSSFIFFPNGILPQPLLLQLNSIRDYSLPPISFFFFVDSVHLSLYIIHPLFTPPFPPFLAHHSSILSMDDVVSPAPPCSTTLTLNHRRPSSQLPNFQTNLITESEIDITTDKKLQYGSNYNAYFMTWRPKDFLYVARFHWLPCIFAFSLLFFMAVEYTLRMIPSSSPPFDLGFVFTHSLHSALASSPHLNTLLAGLNTVFVGMQTTYILWTWLIEGRPRATISALFMFTCRGILGYSTQLPLPQGFLGSGVDFPVGNVSFFLFFSGHVAGSVIASLDMRRMKRWELAWTFDAFNVLQAVRLLGTRGHYTIDLVVGVGAGILFDSLAGKYEETKRKSPNSLPPAAATNGTSTTTITKQVFLT